MNNQTVSYEYFWKKKTIVSFILSVMVVMIHASSFSQYFRVVDAEVPIMINFVNLFFRKALPLIAVPLFFIISGATLFRNYKSDDYVKKIKGRVKTLAIPYLVWNILCMLFAAVISYTFISNFLIGRQKFVFSLSNIFLSIFHYKCNLPFWFIFALMCYVALTPIIDKFIKNKIIGIVIIVGILVLHFFNIKIPVWFILESNSLIFYLIGCYIGKHNFSNFANKSNKKIVALVLFILSLVYFTLIAYETIPENYGVKTVFLLIGAIAFWDLCDVFIDYITLKEYHKQSFLIYAMHFNIQSIIIKFIYILFPKTPYMSVVNFFASTVLTVFCIIIFSMFTKKYFNKLYLVLSGSR